MKGCEAEGGEGVMIMMVAMMMCFVTPCHWGGRYASRVLRLSEKIPARFVGWTLLIVVFFAILASLPEIYIPQVAGLGTTYLVCPTAVQMVCMCVLWK